MVNTWHNRIINIDFMFTERFWAGKRRLIGMISTTRKIVMTYLSGEKHRVFSTMQIGWRRLVSLYFYIARHLQLYTNSCNFHVKYMYIHITRYKARVFAYCVVDVCRLKVNISSSLEFVPGSSSSRALCTRFELRYVFLWLCTCRFYTQYLWLFHWHWGKH